MIENTRLSFKNSVSDPDSGSGSGSRRAKMTNKNRKSNEISCFEVLDFFDTGSRIRDGKNSDPGSEIIIPDPQQWYFN
jgi:hypothetical protein